MGLEGPFLNQQGRRGSHHGAAVPGVLRTPQGSQTFPGTLRRGPCATLEQEGRLQHPMSWSGPWIGRTHKERARAPVRSEAHWRLRRGGYGLTTLSPCRPAPRRRRVTAPNAGPARPRQLRPPARPWLLAPNLGPSFCPGRLSARRRRKEGRGASRLSVVPARRAPWVLGCAPPHQPLRRERPSLSRAPQSGPGYSRGGRPFLPGPRQVLERWRREVRAAVRPSRPQDHRAPRGALRPPAPSLTR